jgi:glucose-6-phosphate 1-dehydrogenase
VNAIDQIHRDTKALAKTASPAPPCTMVIFGGGGDLTKRLLMPAVYNLSCAKLLDDEFSIIAVDRDESSDDAYQAAQDATMRSFTPDKGGEFAEASLNDEGWSWLKSRLHYMAGDFTKPDMFKALADRIDGSAVFYLAVADRFFGAIIDRLHEAGLTREADGQFRRVVIEKPFGHDLESAQELNQHILSELSESQIYRIDHFLGKETVQNIMALRFSNGIFEPLWNRDHIDCVMITASETVGVEKRGKFYEVTGALRDMVPNHMFQLLSMIAMEPPNSFDADDVRSEKAKVIAALHPMSEEDVTRNVVRGQYSAGRMGQDEAAGYRDEPDVSKSSNTETYVALKLMIDNWRWAGVPFYIRTGKRMSTRKTEIAVHFKQAPFTMFRDTPVDKLTPNVMLLHIQPHEGITLEISAKQPGQVVKLDGVRMDFRYEDFFKITPSTGYETLIYDVLIGDPTLFNRADNIEAGWAGVQPILDLWDTGKGEVYSYPAGSNGPDEADDLLTREGRHWRKLP